MNNFAITANGSGGITIFNALNGLTPTRVAVVETEGTAVDVAYTGGLVAVADYQAGLAIVDMTDVANARVVRQVDVGSPVTCVVASGGVAYAGTLDGRVAAVDLHSGRLLWALPVGSAVQDLALVGDALYVLWTDGVEAISLLEDVPSAVSGSAALSDIRVIRNRMRLTAGPGVLYAAHGRGWHVLDIATQPLQPTLVQFHETPQFGFKQLAANGSGLAVAAAGANTTDDGPHDIDLYTVGSDGRGGDFITTFETPGIAEAVSIYNGLAYVADGAGGLQVINYRAYDTQKQPPTVALSSNVALPGGSVEDGKFVRLTAAVTDDVQVREVEFYVDGERVVTDGNFPFEQRVAAPRRTSTKTTFLVKARAIDTGGNSAWSEEYLLHLVPDTLPPSVKAVSLAEAAMVDSLDEFFVRFSELIDLSTLTGPGLRLTEAGADGTHGTADDVVIALTVAFLEETSTARLTPVSPLTRGRYRLTIQAPLADAGGIPLASPSVTHFRVYSPLDSDGDGLPDDWEEVLGLNPHHPDTDGDGIPDGLEDFDNDGLPDGIEVTRLGLDPRIADQNLNGIPDGHEDTDGDGYADGLEAVAGTDLRNPDTDGDGLDDGTEVLAGMNPLVPNLLPATTATSAPVFFQNN